MPCELLKRKFSNPFVESLPDQRLVLHNHEMLLTPPVGAGLRGVPRYGAQREAHAYRARAWRAMVQPRIPDTALHQDAPPTDIFALLWLLGLRSFQKRCAVNLTATVTGSTPPACLCAVP